VGAKAAKKLALAAIAAALILCGLPATAAAATRDLEHGYPPLGWSFQKSELGQAVQSALDGFWSGQTGGAASLATGQTVVTRGTTAYSSAWALPDSGAHRAAKPWEVTGTAPDAGLGMANADGTWYAQNLPTQGPTAAQPEPVNWPSQPDRRYGANAQVSYRTVKSEFAGPERLVDTATRTWTEWTDRQRQNRVETLDLGERRVGPRREGPYLVTDVYRTTATRPVTTWTWRERQATETARVYETPYYYHVTVYRDVTVPGHWEKQQVQETRYWTRTVRETVQIPVTKTVTVPETRYHEVQETRYWTRTVRETVQIPVTKTITVPETRYRWEQREYTRTVRVPVQIPVQETRYRLVKDGPAWYHEPYTVTVWKTVYRDQVVKETRWVQVPYTVYVTKTVTEYQTVTRERVIQEPYTVTVLKPYTVNVTKTVTEYQTVTRERLIQEPYMVTVEKDVWVPERSFSEVASRYDTATPHRVDRRVETSVAYGPWELKSAVDYGPLETRTAYDKLIQHVGWGVEPPAQGVKPPKVVPVITVANPERYEWSNYSQYRREIQAKLLRLEGTALEQCMRVLSQEELARLYGFELVKAER